MSYLRKGKQPSKARKNKIRMKSNSTQTYTISNKSAESLSLMLFRILKKCLTESAMNQMNTIVRDRK